MLFLFEEPQNYIVTSPSCNCVIVIWIPNYFIPIILLAWMPKYVYDAWSLRKEVCILQKLQKVFHCLPLAELRVIPWHCSDPSIFAWGTEC